MPKVSLGRPREARIIFPNIACWMNENRLTYIDIEKATGYRAVTVRYYLTGTNDARLGFILAFLEYSGMTFEEAFERRE